MKMVLAIAMLLVSFLTTSFACTTFFLHKNGQMVFGRNYDWITATGVVNTNLKGLLKTSLPPQEAKKIQWVSKYGSVTFNQYGKEFPTGGMNETGLVVELMWLDDTKYPEIDERPSLDVLQWIQYQLDNCSSVEDVLATDKKIRIDGDGTPQHYLVADAKGKVATIEFLNGKMMVHTGADLQYPVLTNNTYASSLLRVKTAEQKKESTVFQDNSIQRFATASNMVKQFQQSTTTRPIVDYAFGILGEVAQGDFTKWSIVYDISNKQVHFKTQLYQQVKSFTFSSFNFACNATPLYFNMNQIISGNINDKFSPFNNEANTKYLKQACEQSKPQVNVSDESIKQIANVAMSVKCK